MKSLKYYIQHPTIIGIIVLGKLGRWLPDEIYLKMKFHLIMGYRLNLNKPQTFAEKLQWLKLYDHKSIYHQMVDKVESKVFIDRAVGPGHTIPTLGVYDSFEQIEWDVLPRQFILKATHDSGSYYIVSDKNAVNKSECKRKLYVHWNKDYYTSHREWQYKGLKSRIIAEPLLVDEGAPYLRDFKFYCFNGEPKIFYITSDKGGSLPTRQDFFDISGNPIDLEDVHYSKNPVKAPDLPSHLDEMIFLARKLSKDTYHLRVDFYEIKGHVYVGELTFCEASGFCSFTPERWNYTLGEWIHLPIDN